MEVRKESEIISSGKAGHSSQTNILASSITIEKAYTSPDAVRTEDVFPLTEKHSGEANRIGDENKDVVYAGCRNAFAVPYPQITGEPVLSMRTFFYRCG